VYLYSYANTEAKAHSEAAHALRLLKGYNPTYPVYYDLEDKTVNLGQAHLTKIATIFCDTLKAAGYEVASYSGYTFEQLLQGTAEQRELLETVDVLIDGPFVQAERSLELNFRGSRNQRILNVKASLAAGQAVLETSPRWLGEY
jgi:hypothetical protein